MGSIQVSEADFVNLSLAANRAYDAGEIQEAEALDRIARKANAALAHASGQRASPWPMRIKKLSWEEVPSCLPVKDTAKGDT